MKEYYLTNAKHLILEIGIPYQEMLREAIAISDNFVPHRGDESQGWESLTLHGLSEHQTGSSNEYGYKDDHDAARDMNWTSAADKCPITKDFFLNKFPSSSYGRIRFMKLKAGGYIGAHNDTQYPILENTNIVLNNPKECVWKWQDTNEEMYMLPGSAYLMNIHYFHSVYNRSNQDRYHMIVTRLDSTDEWKRLVCQAAKAADVNGKFLSIDQLKQHFR